MHITFSLPPSAAPAHTGGTGIHVSHTLQMSEQGCQGCQSAHFITTFEGLECFMYKSNYDTAHTHSSNKDHGNSSRIQILHGLFTGRFSATSLRLFLLMPG